ncbi:MAG TPA: DNA topoisomerase, partial [Pseudomonas sp.]|nr:DNA topoisomerase [Pseudomonas sp.]
NAYLHELTGADFTAKDYRTWAGSALALEALRELRCETQTDAKKELVDMVKAVSRTLGNTPAVCRKCYIHPGVLDAFLAGDLCTLPKPRKRKGLKEEEVLLLNFLQRLEERMAETQAA